jgi:hypothetical protein
VAEEIEIRALTGRDRVSRPGAHVPRERAVTPGREKRARNVGLAFDPVGLLELRRQLPVLRRDPRSELLHRGRQVRAAAERGHFVRIGPDEHRHPLLQLLAEDLADLVGQHQSVDGLLRAEARHGKQLFHGHLPRRRNQIAPAAFMKLRRPFQPDDAVPRPSVAPRPGKSRCRTVKQPGRIGCGEC